MARGAALDRGQLFTPRLQVGSVRGCCSLRPAFNCSVEDGRLPRLAARHVPREPEDGSHHQSLNRLHRAAGQRVVHSEQQEFADIEKSRFVAAGEEHKRDGVEDVLEDPCCTIRISITSMRVGMGEGWSLVSATTPAQRLLLRVGMIRYTMGIVALYVESSGQFLKLSDSDLL
jgi:hypothetical protein